jgi:DNA-binding response OmpR family regulator
MRNDRSHILLVEDDVPAGKAIAKTLIGEQHEVTLAHDGKTAVDLLERSNITSTFYDVVITDIRLPEASGIEVLYVARGMRLPPSVILLTAYASVDTAIAAMRAGAHDYIRKPCDMEELLECVEKALEKRLESFHQQEKNRALVRITRLIEGLQDESPEQEYPSILQYPGGIVPFTPIDAANIDPYLQVGDIFIDCHHRSIFIRNEFLHTTPTEFRLLHALAMARQRPLSYREIVRHTHGYDDMENTEAAQLLRWHVRNLRQKIPDGYIVQVRGLGYVLKEPWKSDEHEQVARA